MIIRCAVCKKQVVVQWPELWGYKRKNRFMCSWKCLRAFDNKEKGAKDVYTKTKKDGTPAKKSGPKVELVYDPSIAEEYRREKAQKEANECARVEELIKSLPPVNVGTEAPDESEVWHTAAIRNKRMGTFYYDEKFRMIDWRHPGGEEIILPLADWKILPELIPQIMRAMGLD